jgi:cystathionine beta-lyase/cystathionine gamma-synthase
MNISPYDAWLNLKEDRAGSNRCQTISDSAMVIAEYLSDHEAIEKVYYPGLISNSSHNAAAKVMKEGRYFGGKIGLSIKSTKKQTSEEVTQEVSKLITIHCHGWLETRYLSLLGYKLSTIVQARGNLFL